MLELNDICKRYTTGSFTQVALDHVSVAFRDNEFVAVLGPSGSGKTTMLNIVGGLDHFDEGDLVIDGISTRRYKDRDWDTYRNNRIGFVFQSYNLIPHQTVLANVELALTLSGVGRSERRRRALDALARVGLADHVNKKPSQLSGGQMQRVAIARALINDPEILLADEPTGALDSATSVQVMDLLKEVAQDRLVIMVTHNPELAHQYATRIVELSDGHITSDSDPFDPATAPRREAKRARRTSMSFLTALGLSFNNLMTKKGRTIMTAFAGSIGIIGIAAILALANGVNEYIARVEEDTLSSYPLTISKQSMDISGMLSEDPGATEQSSREKDGDAEDPAQIPEFMMLTDMFASVGSNDLSGLKSYLESGKAGIEDYVNAIQYDYGITPLVYAADTSDGVTQLNPNALSTAMTGGASGTATAGMSTGGMSVFNEMIDDQELLDSQYDVVAGRWATEADECVLVLTQSGRISDYTLYGIGVLDPADLTEMVSSAMSGTAGETEIAETDVDFTYDDALALDFKVISPADVYRRNAETGGWTDMSSDEEFMTDAVNNGLDLHVVGVVRPNESSDAKALSAGIAYTPELTLELMDRSDNSQIVQQQLEDPEVDVFTGKTFDTLQEEAKKGVDLESLFSVDEDTMRSAFSFDTSAIAAGFDPSGIDLSGISVDLTSVANSVDVESLVAGAPAPDFSAILDQELEDPTLTTEQLEEVAQLGGQLSQGFVAWWGENAGAIDPDDPEFVQKLAGYFDQYLETEGAQAILAQVEAVAGQPVRDRVQQIVSDYVSNSLAPYLQSFLQSLTSQISSAISSQLQSAMASVLEQYASQAVASLSNLQSSFSVNADMLASSIHFNMDAEDLASLMESYANASQLTYDNNLQTLGYATADDPAAIQIYPKDFEAKEHVVDAIDVYNDEQRAAGNDDAVISYTDYMGVIMGSVTDIVNMISLVLIAFVSISLVVSSIMIGIITYISVLERKKEIGILRAIGASKGNVANVFNAETFIEGLISGVFAIAVVVAVSVPVNAWVLRDFNVENIMSLPWTSAAVLICISVVLTLVAGLIPSSAASRRDPVEALRSE
ncbi:ABC transporter ATP-binding protein/permease [Thermophilibacter provencensis]|uniref:ABC transporter ATP-binding protein/permease n=1 Tax=Thermophilibacter provencensis TaxID=1852386 RepID=A0ABT7V1K5_9ACTN|nr:ABC transporter ATP-binding protein/permease [Thermophilibacter provencensis]MDM8270487.1 ABC transporter ATP-binding protein/permease [Thermophilibacter provencensis]